MEDYTCPHLQEIRSKIQHGTFLHSEFPKISLTKAHDLAYGRTKGGRRGCKCRSKKGCTPNCGCRKHKMACVSSCICAGKCNNPYNEL